MRHLWSIHMSGIPRHTYLHPNRNFYPTSRFTLSVLSLHMSGIPITWIYNLVGTSTGPAGSFSLCSFLQAVRCHTDLHPGRNIYLTSWFIVSVLISVSPHGCLWFILSVLFWLAVGRLWSLHLSLIPRHTDLCPGMNVYLASWLIQSVLFLTGSETSHGPPPWKECLPDQLVHCVCVDFWQVVRRLWSLHVAESPVTWTSTLLGMPTWLAVSFSLCCFWQVVSHHTDLHSGRNVYLTSWFIQSVFVLTGSEMSHRPPPW